MSQDAETRRAKGDDAAQAAATAKGGRRPISMHEGIGVWCDCCSCEAEPYWVEIAQEMGMDLSSDYEDDAADRHRGSGS
jgi:hypothetical protein